MTSSTRVDFFDGIAERWDGWDDLAELAQKLAAGLDEFGVRAEETVLDVGCGTGNLTRALLAKLSSAGRVIAVDISPMTLMRLARASASRCFCARSSRALRALISSITAIKYLKWQPAYCKAAIVILHQVVRPRASIFRISMPLFSCEPALTLAI